MEEIWKNIEGYENLYQVSSKGRVKSLERIDNNNHPVKERILKCHKQNNGYLMVYLSKNGKRKHHLIHRLVAQAFIPNHKNKSEVDHINTDRTDNRVENLRWVTRSENQNNPLTKKKLSKNSPKPCLGRIGSKHHRSKPILQFDEYGNFIQEWECAMDVERILGINNNHIGSVCNGNRKTAGGFVWRHKKEKAA